MTNTDGLSDSQVSAILNDEEFDQLQKEVASVVNLPLLTDDVMDDLKEEKYNINLSLETRDICHLPRVAKEECLRNGNQDEFQEIQEAVYYQEVEPSVPIREEFPGNLNFQIQLPPQTASKHWVYSQTLKKVFINMEQTLPLRFKWEPPMAGLNLRTTMVFSLDQYRNDPVRRCHNHMAPTYKSNLNADPRLAKYVVRCLDHSSRYEERNEHLSVVTPLRTPQPGSQYVPMCFQFFCKNSCTSGMNRRPTELIFTLENNMGKVLGRRRLLVRVCSCPKRDKEKEETEARESMPTVKRRKLSMPSGGKKMSCDTHVFTMQLNIVGKENYLAVMKYAYDIMAGQAVRTGNLDLFKPYMDDITRKIP